jgi:GTP-binding protein EngB required for normal cell division
VLGAGRPLTDQTPLDRLAAFAVELGNHGLAAEATSLNARLEEGRFNVACVGQFKRGKSSLINALVGQPIVPTGIVPVTAVPTVIRYGERLAARVRRIADGWSAIDPGTVVEFVSEGRNPRNARQVEIVEVFVPSDLLRDGLCLVDTPGLGSVFAWNATATRAFVPNIDAAVLVLGADPPVSREELELAADVARHTRELIVVLNKADRFNDAERAEAIGFTERVLTERLGVAVQPMLAVSALRALAAGYHDDAWTALVERLHQLTAAARALLAQVRQRGTERLAGACLGEVAEAREALRRPVEETERRLDTLQRTIGDVAQHSRQFGHLLAAEREHLERVLTTVREAFLRRAFPDAERALDVLLAGDRAPWGPRLRRNAMDHAATVARKHIVPWLAQQQVEAETQYREIGNRFVTLANGYLARAASSGVPGLDRLPPMLGPEHAFRARSAFRFTELLDLAHQPSPVRWLLDVLRPAIAQHRATRRAALAYLRRLFDTNSTRVMSDLHERVFESQRSLESEVRRHLQMLNDSAERALATARNVRAQGAEAVAARLDHLDVLRREIEALHSANTSSDAAVPR